MDCWCGGVHKHGQFFWRYHSVFLATGAGKDALGCCLSMIVTIVSIWGALIARLDAQRLGKKNYGQ